MPGFYLIGGETITQVRQIQGKVSRNTQNKGFLKKDGVDLCRRFEKKIKKSYDKIRQGQRKEKTYRRYCDPKKGRFNELKLIGLSSSNVHAYYEGTVMHGASYVPPGDSGGAVAGTSKGCPAFYEGDFERVAKQMGGTQEETSLYYSYAPQCQKKQKDKGDYVKKVLSMKDKVLSEKEAIEDEVKRSIEPDDLMKFNKYLEDKNIYYLKQVVRPKDYEKKSYGKKSNWVLRVHKSFV